MTKISNQYSLTNILTADLANSRLGINNVSPTVALDVTGAGKFSGATTFSTSVNITTNGNPLFLNNSTNTTSVGMKFTNGGGNYFIGVSNSGGTGYLSGSAYAFNIQSEGAQDLQFGTNNANRMTITSAGNVGIGTTSPNKNSVGRALTVNASSGNSMYELTTADSATTAYWEYTGTNSSIINVANGYLRFGTNNAENMRITSGGNVGIGTSSPSAKLNIAGGDRGTSIRVDSSDNAGVALYSTAGNREYQLYSAPDSSFTILDNTAVVTRFKIANSGVVTITNLGSGAVTATSGVLSTTSDMTLKVEDGYIDNALEKISQLKPRYFYWKEESGLPTDIRQLGFYAQEVNQALGEEAANTPKNENDKWGIYDRGIIAMLTKAVQELSAENTSLINRIEALENK